MASRISLAVCLAVLSTVGAGSVAPSTTLSPSVGKQLLQEFRSMKHTLSSMNENLTSQYDGLKGMFTSKQKPVPYSQQHCVSSTELQEINKKLLALDTKLGATEAKLESTQARLERTEAKQATARTELKSTQTKLEATQTKLEATQTKLESAQTKLESAQTKLEATQTRLERTEARTGRRLAATEAKQKAAGKVLRSTQATLKTLQSNSKSGIAGGSWYLHSGSAANPLCLTLTPQTDGTRVPRYHALLYGSEYQNIPNHHDQDVPCSVCLAPQPTTIMIPTTHTCPNGWTTQYRGYLSAGDPIHKAASQFVCVDKDPENAAGGNMNQNGYVFYLTATRCGSLPCPPYSNNQVVLCVVCSK